MFSFAQSATRPVVYRTPTQHSASASDYSVHSLSSASTPWSLVSPDDTRPATPPLPTPPAPENNDRPWQPGDPSAWSARVAVLMAESECQHARGEMQSTTLPPKRSTVARVLALDTVRLHYHRDAFLGGPQKDAKAVERLWNAAIKPVFDDSTVYAAYPDLRYRFLERAYGVYVELRRDRPEHESLWLDGLHRLSTALLGLSRGELARALGFCGSTACTEDSLPDVARASVSVSQWERAVQQWTPQTSASVLLEKSFATLLHGA